MDSSLERGGGSGAPGRWAERLARTTLPASPPPSGEALPLALAASRGWVITVPSRATGSAASEDGPSPSARPGGDYLSQQAPRGPAAVREPFTSPSALAHGSGPGSDGLSLVATRTPPAEVGAQETTPTRRASDATAATDHEYVRRPPAVQSAGELAVTPPARLRPTTDERIPAVLRPRRAVSTPGAGAEDQDGAVARPPGELADGYDGLEERLARRERLDMHR
jgi:hypothetical protein